MAFPVLPLVRPSILDGRANGRLPDQILRTVPGVPGGAPATLVVPAARAWNALQHAALTAGHVLDPSSSYRTYDAQERLFRARYQTTPIKTSDIKRWQGRSWYKLPGVPVTAAPGTSNHGNGLAVDTGEERDGDAPGEPLDSATLAWLIANEHRFGFSHEIQSEPWHIRYVAGDRIPPAILEFEEAQRPPSDEEDDMPPAPAPVVDNAGHLWCFIRGTDGALWGQRDHGQWIRYGGNLTSGPAAVPNGVDGVMVYARGADGGTWRAAIAPNTLALKPEQWVSEGGLS